MPSLSAVFFDLGSTSSTTGHRVSLGIGAGNRDAELRHRELRNAEGFGIGTLEFSNSGSPSVQAADSTAAVVDVGPSIVKTRRNP